MPEASPLLLPYTHLQSPINRVDYCSKEHQQEGENGRPKSTQTTAEPGLKGGCFRSELGSELGGDFWAPAYPKPLNRVLRLEERWAVLDSLIIINFAKFFDVFGWIV